MIHRALLLGLVVALLGAVAVAAALVRSSEKAPAKHAAAGPQALDDVPLLGAEDGPAFALPIACELGRDCEIQNYVDLDPGTGVRDYRCGVRTYDGHTGTDFRLRDMAQQAQGVSVLAAAPGVVLRIRNDVPDMSVIERGAMAVEGQECGNGLVIDHGGGLSTQYCHMAMGSLAVAPGDRVETGTELGRVGLSGQTEYPHLHFTARRDNVVIEPFLPSGGPDSPSCSPATGSSMWRTDAVGGMSYKSRVALNTGFSDGPVTMEGIEAGATSAAISSSSALVAYVRALGLQIGDVDRIVVTGPDGDVIAENTGRPLATNRAQQMIFAGRRAPPGGWPRGTYEAVYTVRAEGRIVFEQRFSVGL